MSRPMLLVGCGKMGGAMLDGWIESGATAGGVHVVEPDTAAADRFAGVAGVSIDTSIGDLPLALDPSVVIIAVKPQTMDEVVAPLRLFASPSTVFLSIAAGKTIAYFEKWLGEHAPIVRAMPNTPAAIGRGISVYVPNDNVSQSQSAACGALLEAVGEAVPVDDEALLDPVTAVSGSGPAYVFLLIETLAAAGERSGLPTDLAMRLARATVAGAGELARQSDEGAAQLRRNVTSPGGTTAAALEVLMANDGMQPLMERAVAAASARSEQLAD